MRDAHASQTSAAVAAARALAHHHKLVDGFDDPFGVRLLPPPWNQLVAALLADGRGMRLLRAPLAPLLRMAAGYIALRARALDEAIFRAPPTAQVVILGAGLDTRAWRLPALAGRDLYEVDHPATQSAKEARLGSLPPPRARRAPVAVDFTRDALAERLSAAGHDAAHPTVWIWEGVVMYLPEGAIRATLSVVQARSAPGSVLGLSYLGGGPVRALLQPTVALLGEPLRSELSAGAVSALLQEYGATVLVDWSEAEQAERWLRSGKLPFDVPERVALAQWG
jgi:methyltransferase (TIGR00027 family)